MACSPGSTRVASRRRRLKELLNRPRAMRGGGRTRHGGVDPARWGMTDRDESVVAGARGTLIAYTRSGSGPPVLLVHGGGVNARNMALVARALAPTFTVFLMQRRGRTQHIDAATYRIEDEYEDVCAVARAALEPVHVLAHSYGAVCALGALARDPSVFRTATLYEPPIPTPHVPVVPVGLPDRLDALIAAGEVEEALLAGVREGVMLNEAEIAGWRAMEPAWRASIELVPAFAWEIRALSTYQLPSDALARVTLPVSLVVGEHSNDKYVFAADALERVLPNPRRIVLAGERHLATASVPQGLAQIIVDADARA